MSVNIYMWSSTVLSGRLSIRPSPNNLELWNLINKYLPPLSCCSQIQSSIWCFIIWYSWSPVLWYVGVLEEKFLSCDLWSWWGEWLGIETKHLTILRRWRTHQELLFNKSYVPLTNNRDYLDNYLSDGICPDHSLFRLEKYSTNPIW